MIELAKRRLEQDSPSNRQRLDDWEEEISDQSLIEYAQNADNHHHLWDDNKVSDSTLLQIDDEQSTKDVFANHPDFDIQLSLKSEKKFASTASMKTFSLTFKSDTRIAYNKLEEKLAHVFDQAIHESRVQAGAEYTKGKIVIEAPGVEPIIVPLQPFNLLSGALVIETINGVLQSHQDLDIDSGEIDVSISTLSLPSGEVNTKYVSEDSAHLKSSVSRVVNNAVACMGQDIAISFAKASVTKNMPPKPR